MKRYLRLYRRLLLLYPQSFRQGYEDEMVRTLADQLREAHGSGSLAIFLHAAVDVFRTAPGQHMEREVPMARPVTGPGDFPAVDASTRRNAVLVAGLPLVLLVVLSAAAPGFLDPAFANPPAVLGLPAGVVILIAALAWSAVGLLIAGRRPASTGALLISLVVFVGPATIAVVLTPALVLILQNIVG